MSILKRIRWVAMPTLDAVALAVFVTPAPAAGPATEALRGVNASWVLIAAFLVFFMQAAFAFVEAGLSCAKNTVNILFKNLIDFVFATLAFWAIPSPLFFLFMDDFREAHRGDNRHCREPDIALTLVYKGGLRSDGMINLWA